MINPRFKKGQEIEYNPASGWKPRVSWEIYEISVGHQEYYLRRFDGTQSRKRVLLFKDQRKYRLSNTPLEQQPPKYP